MLTGGQANTVNLNWGTQLPGFGGGPFGYYEVRSNGPYPQLGIITEGNVHSNNVGLFIQDAWTVNNKLTVNLGLRTESEEVPAYSTQEGVPTHPISFAFSDKLAPRLGFAYDMKGDGRWKVYRSWGIFYDIMKLELPRGSFGGDKWLSYCYSLDTYTFDTLVSAASCPPACSGTLIRGPIDFRHVSTGADTLDPNLQAHEERGGVVRPRAPALAGDGRQRPLRPQVARPRGRGHGLARRGGQRESTSSPTRAKG